MKQVLTRRIEGQIGIACAQQRIRYLEDSDLPDNITLYEAGVVPGAVIEVHLWSDWAGGILAGCFDGTDAYMAICMASETRLRNVRLDPKSSSAQDALFLAAFQGAASICRVCVLI